MPGWSPRTLCANHSREYLSRTSLAFNVNEVAPVDTVAVVGMLKWFVKVQNT